MKKKSDSIKKIKNGGIGIITDKVNKKLVFCQEALDDVCKQNNVSGLSPDRIRLLYDLKIQLNASIDTLNWMLSVLKGMNT